MPEPSILDARLAEIDRRLRMIQSGLEPVHEDPEASEVRDDPVVAPSPPVRNLPDDPVAEPLPPMPDLPDLLEPLPPMPDLLEPPAPPPSLIARRLAPPPRRFAGDRAAGDRQTAGDRPADDRDEEIAVLTARLNELTAAHERLLATTQDLLIEQADTLARAAPTVSVAAGPFTDTPALQAFQRALTGLPHVREVAVREYVGTEGVMLDVHLDAPIS